MACFLQVGIRGFQQKGQRSTCKVYGLSLKPNQDNPATKKANNLILKMGKGRDGHFAKGDTHMAKEHTEDGQRYQVPGKRKSKPP